MKLSGFEAIVRALNDAAVRYLLVGGLAVNAHGYGRNTFDVDIVIQLHPQNIQNAFDAVSRAHPSCRLSGSQPSVTRIASAQGYSCRWITRETFELRGISGRTRGGRSADLGVGVIAVNAHGDLRVTKDVEIVIRLERGNIVAAFASLAAIGYLPSVPVPAEEFADPVLRERWRQEKGTLVLNM